MSIFLSTMVLVKAYILEYGEVAERELSKLSS